VRSQRPVWDLNHPEHTSVGHGGTALRPPGDRSGGGDG